MAATCARHGPQGLLRNPSSRAQTLVPVISRTRCRQTCNAFAPRGGSDGSSSAPRNILSSILHQLQSSRSSSESLLQLVQLLDAGNADLVSTEPGEQPIGKWERVIEAMLLQPPSEHLFDSFALRNLVLQRPESCTELSSLLVSPDHYVERRVVTSRTGEESVLTFSLRQANADSKHSASGASSGRDPWGGSSGQHQGRGIHGYDEGDGSAWLADHADLAPMGFVMDSGMVGQDPGGSGAGGSSHRWKLTRVRGEPLHASLPEQPSPEWAPEAVVAAQLEYLQRGQFGQVFNLLSPTAQGWVGPVDRFVTNMSRSRAYRLLLGHASATSIRRCQSSPSTFLEVVAVEGVLEGGGSSTSTSRDGSRASQQEGSGAGKERALFCWIVRRLAEEGPLRDCWLTDWVKVVDDPSVLKALRMDTGSSGAEGAGGSA